jgi:membrane associated rhomboid family serine protease
VKPEGGFGGASFAPPRPVVTFAVIAVCVAVQLAIAVGGAAFGDTIVGHAGLIPARLTGGVPGLSGDVPAVLTLVSALFLHAGWVHLAVNLSFLLWVGRHVEMVAGPLRFAMLYLIGGIAGGLLHVVVDPASLAPVVGASGAIAAVFGTYAMLFARRRVATQRVVGVTIPGRLLTALWYMATWVGLQFLTALALNSETGGIAIWTHIGGFVVGLLAARPLERRLL